MRLFRYLDNQYGPRFAALGLFGISTTTSVAAIEGPQKDAFDGVTFHRLNKTISNPDDGTKEILRRHGIHWGKASSASFVGCTVEHQAQGYICCLCRSPDSTAFPGKEWVFEITDLEAFIKTLTRASGGRLTNKAYVGEIEYSDKQADALDPATTLIDPFVKAKRFESEEEVRIYWDKAAPVSRFSVLDLKLLNYVRLVSRP